MIRHYAECEECDKRVEAQAPQGIYHYWRAPREWKTYENGDFCSDLCVAKRIDKDMRHEGKHLPPGLWTRLFGGKS